MKTIDHFTCDDFEQALPNGCVKLGIIEGEYCYLLPVTNNAGILIRSSIDRTGQSGEQGQDSIRVWPCRCARYNSLTKPVWTYELQGKSDSRWVTRLPGWQNRLQDSILKLTAYIETAGSCPKCGRPLIIRKVKKEGANKGRWFASCRDKDHKSFVWLD